MSTVGLILAGGQARRMGGADKPLLPLGGETLLARTIARARPQVGELVLNANGDLSRFEPSGLTILPDRIGGYLGPLAGILTGLAWMRKSRPEARWLATFACDCPFFPLDMVAQLISKAERHASLITIAASGERHHPVFAIWNRQLPSSPEDILNDLGIRKVDEFIERFASTRVQFEAEKIDPFFNINTPDDLARAEAMLT